MLPGEVKMNHLQSWDRTPDVWEIIVDQEPRGSLCCALGGGALGSPGKGKDPQEDFFIYLARLFTMLS